MKQKEYGQWNDPKEVYSVDYFLSKKGVAILHEYLVECNIPVGNSLSLIVSHIVE